MDKQVIAMNDDSKKLLEIVSQVPQKELEEVTRMNRKQRREWIRDNTRKRGRGYTR